MLYRSFFPRDLFADIERMQRELDRNLGGAPSIRGGTRGYPAMNVGTTARSVDVYAFAPGMDPDSLEVQIEKGMLAISGERKNEPAGQGATVHIDERFGGRFRRVVSLPDDVDANAVTATYRDGVLHVCVARKEPAQARRIPIQ
ncbi:Hsp20/alpha crystallin family protein [Parasulfuritortus cantonensis]|uniref:Hsp20/alpha crystallin family protein n=1 Tax=Parasulfuritortus cantonensis TaxID=2528202 RepID=A0A4R1B8Q3_9PROT|nr:Hsp20/alpha crystallin family protein [Parasulfuritortus cantonensis]TCJ13175.1 Hsp20/alpha crystallin family protein [Parasulfuritortus cantonensis]